ncbi:hypothetical protein P7K49_029854 [Saguinus oedipus]|uniref:Uncharacterized protein n=1 Tax=Saguinus oedipus TaxID=9490 RepID=A0ABQ9U981_SAGOE|nr:hypothetical protein P7K49_029854 [Saguinus oedipus]
MASGSGGVAAAGALSVRAEGGGCAPQLRLSLTSQDRRGRPRLERAVPGATSRSARPPPPARAPRPRQPRPSASLADQSGGEVGLPAPRPAQRQPMSGRVRRPVRAAREEPAQSEKSEPNPSGPPLRTRSRRRLLPPDRVYCPNPKVQFCGPAAASGRDDTGVRQVSEARESGRREGAALRGRTCRERARSRPGGRAGGWARGAGRGLLPTVHFTPPRPLPRSPARLFVRSELREETPASGKLDTGGAVLLPSFSAPLGRARRGPVPRRGRVRREVGAPPMPQGLPAPARSASGARWGARWGGTGGLLQVISGRRLVTRRPAVTSRTEM